MFENSTDIGCMAGLRGERIRSRVEHHRRVRECRRTGRVRRPALTALAGGQVIFTALQEVVIENRKRNS